MSIQQLKITRLDGTEIVVTPNLGDTLNFETTLRKNKAKWGTLEENALKMGPFRAWSAGRREGSITETWDEFTTNVADVSNVEAVEDTDEDTETPLGLGTPTEQPTTYS
ncbi:hypothetical protein [Arthrobacter sp. HLT1-21]